MQQILRIKEMLLLFVIFRGKCAKGRMRLQEVLEEKTWPQKATFLSRCQIRLEDLNVGVIKRFIDPICESSDEHIIDSLKISCREPLAFK